MLCGNPERFCALVIMGGKEIQVSLPVSCFDGWGRFGRFIEKENAVNPS